MRPSRIGLFALLLATLLPALSAQERLLSFDQARTLFEILGSSPHAQPWKAELGDFDRLIAFDADSLIQLEVFRSEQGVPVRVRKFVERAWFASRQMITDSIATTVVRQGGPLTPDEIEDLRTTFTADQTGYSAFHGLTIATVLESGPAFWLVTGASYFAISAMADNLDVTRANVEGARYGHLTGLLQGYAGGVALFGEEGVESSESVKPVLATTSAAGIARAITSYQMMTGPDVNPTTQYLRLVTERHSLLWGAGLALIISGENSKTRTVMGAAITTSLSSLLWSKPLFAMEERKMSWGDALLVDEFMTPWYLTLGAAAASFEISGERNIGALLTFGGISGYLLGMNVNEGRNRELSTVRRTRLLMYGGSLVGLGLIAGAELKQSTAWWVLAGTTWAGYLIGTTSGRTSSTSAWELEVRPEGYLLGSLDRPSPFPDPATIVHFSYRF